MKIISMWKNVGRFTPPKSPGKIYPSNRLYDLPPQIAREDEIFTPQIVCMIYPLPPKLPGKIYPSNHLYDLPPPKSPGKMEDLLLKSSVRFTPLTPWNCLYL